MKTKTSLIATAITMALFSSAHADTTTVIDMTGSTAGRATIHADLITATGPLGVLNGNVAPKFRWYSATGATGVAAAKADGAIYLAESGTTPNKNTVIVRTFWAGSASGVNYVSNQTQLDYKLLATTVSFASNTQIAGDTAALTTAGALAPASAETVAEFGFSDVKQASTPYQSVALAEQTDMFVIPFKFVKTNQTDLAGVTNITSQQARALFTTGGQFKLSRFTGNIADATKFVYAVGRDNDSGTRITTFAETGIGVFTTATQYGFTVSDNGTSADKTDDTINTPVELFDGGYASGGSVATILGATGFNAIGYVGSSDAASAITNGGLELTFNGVAFSNNNVINGYYTFWSKYQAIRKQTLTGTTSTFFGSMKTTLTGLATQTDGTSIKLTDMKCTRAADGAVVK